jgi:hypothetical protein
LVTSITKNKVYNDIYKKQALALKLLRQLNNSRTPNDAINSILKTVKAYTGVEAIGIRLRKGFDYPYYVWDGFKKQHILKENSLCAYDTDGQLLLDDDGEVVLECMCGKVIHGDFDPLLPYFTSRGSFWTNNTTALLKSFSSNLGSTRNVCNVEGYESVALFPFGGGGVNNGLLQLCDSRPNIFSEDLILFLEELCESIGVAVSRLLDEEKRNNLLHMYGERIKELTCLYEISKLFERKDLTLDVALQMIVDLIPPAWQYPEITCARITFKDQVIESKNFIETRWKQSSRALDIDGLVEVYYKEEMPESFEGPFLREERALLDVIAERVSGIVEKYRFIELLNIFDKHKNKLSSDERSRYLSMALNRYLDRNT